MTFYPLGPDFAHTYRFAFASVVLVGGGGALLLIIGGALAPSLVMSLVGLALGLTVLGYLATTVFVVQVDGERLRLRTGLGRRYDVALDEVVPSVRRAPRRRRPVQLAVRWPGKRISVSVPSHPSAPARRLGTALEATAPPAG